MPKFYVDILFFALALVFAFLATRQYLANGKRLTLQGRNWRRMAVLFLLLSCALFVVVRLRLYESI